MKKQTKNIFYSFLGAMLIFNLFSANAYARTIMQLMPTLTISEDYTDNYLKTSTAEQEEFITSYALGFSVGFLNQTNKIYLSYDPTYKDYKNFDDRDRLQQNFSMNGEFNPTKFTNLYADVSYSGNNDKLAGESYEQSAVLSGDTQITKNTLISYSESFVRSFDQQERTGSFLEHDVNTTRFELNNQFGQKNSRGFNVIYAFDSYDNPDADEYKKINPGLFYTYWFNPLNGLDFDAEIEKVDFDTTNKDITSYKGFVRYIRSFSRHFEGYLKYKHTYSDRENGDHTIYNPSVGFDWQIEEDSGISLGVGLLINKWDNTNSDSTDPFLDLNAYKIFNFSPRGTFSITGSSGYSDAGEDAASLGYTTYYEAGAKMDYQLFKRVGSNLFATYKLDEFHEDLVNRKDKEYTFGGGLTWTALKWLRINLDLTHTNFSTDAGIRGDYTENKIFISAAFIPTSPVRPEFTASRSSLESDIFNH